MPEENQLPKGNKKQRGTLLVVLIVIVLLLLGYQYWNSSKETVTTVAEGQQLTTASSGKVVSTFPEELILEGGDIKTSYSLSYQDENIDQPVVRYVSKKSYEENISTYYEYLTTNGWQLTNEANPIEKPATFFYAHKDNAEVNITFIAGADNVTVNILYVVKK